ncbi:NAD(P)/FAD-dependent oxidoreductase [Streptomyces rishiriensis]|uniref:NAD(P)/FAD-dependent oxidoreductase n=1 Tax=Streptomyces rishiriensis TaxID=68264 RepID=UPI0033F4546C
MSSCLIDAITADPRVRVQVPTGVVGMPADSGITGLDAVDRTSRRRSIVAVSAVFVFIGAAPRTDRLAQQPAMDPDGFLLTGRDVALPADHRMPLPFETSMPGVFCVGDVRSGSVKRAAAAVGEGSAAVRACLRSTQSPRGRGCVTAGTGTRWQSRTMSTPRSRPGSAASRCDQPACGNARLPHSARPRRSRTRPHGCGLATCWCRALGRGAFWRKLAIPVIADRRRRSEPGTRETKHRRRRQAVVISNQGAIHAIPTLPRELLDEPGRGDGCADELHPIPCRGVVVHRCRALPGSRAG